MVVIHIAYIIFCFNPNSNNKVINYNICIKSVKNLFRYRINIISISQFLAIGVIVQNLSSQAQYKFILSLFAGYIMIAMVQA